MRSLFVVAAVLAMWSALPSKAEAADAVAKTTLTVRAGPSGNYPAIGRISRGTPVNVRGCSAGFRWCDVSARGFRGWVPGNYLNSNYRNRTVSVLEIGPSLHLPIVTYTQRDYWGTHYYDRDFYRTKYGWNNDHNRYGWRRTNNGWAHGHNWRDTDHDGVSNRYDRDDDNDGVRDRYDSHPNRPNRGWYND